MHGLALHGALPGRPHGPGPDTVLELLVALLVVVVAAVVLGPALPRVQVPPIRPSTGRGVVVVPSVPGPDPLGLVLSRCGRVVPQESPGLALATGVACHARALEARARALEHDPVR